MNSMRDKMHIILIILVFAFVGTIVFDWGMNYVGRRGIGGTRQGIIGSVNGKNISYEYFTQQLQQEYLRIRELTGSEPDIARMKEARDDVWERIINQILIEKEIEKNNISVTDKEIVYIIKNSPPEFLKSHPQFLTDEKFDIKKYQDAINNPKVDWSEIENFVRLSQPSRKIQNIISSTIRVSSKEVEKQIFLLETKVNTKYTLSRPEDFANVEITIPDKEINEYYNLHKQDFMENEMSKLKYVSFSTNVTKQDTITVISEAKNLKERIESGEDFAELAKEYSQDPSSENGGELGWFTKGDMIKAFEDAAFSAKKGEVVGPIETNNGLHIIKILDKKMNKKGETDSVKASHILLKIIPSLETVNNAKYKSNDFAEEAKSNGFEETANKNKLEINETQYFPNNGFIPGIGIIYEVSEFASRAKVNDVSEPIKTDEGYYVFKLIEKLPERIKPLNETKNTIENILKREERMKLAEQKINKIYSNVKSGKPFGEAAKEESMEIMDTGNFGFYDYITGVGNETKFSGAALKLNPGEVSQPIQTIRGWYIIQSIEKSKADTSNVNVNKNYIYMNLLEGKRQLVYTAWLEYLKNKAKINDYRDKYF